MASYQESLLSRKITKLSQDLISLKSPQRYLTGQAKGFVSNTIRVNSRIIRISQGYELRGIRGTFKFTGDKVEKVVIPKLKFQLYNSSGGKIPVTDSIVTGSVTIYAMSFGQGDKPNETEFAVYFYTSGQTGTTDAFYGDFWCVGNDSGILKYDFDLSDGS